jgi:hypothetical protein
MREVAPGSYTIHSTATGCTASLYSPSFPLATPRPSPAPSARPPPPNCCFSCILASAPVLRAPAKPDPCWPPHAVAAAALPSTLLSALLSAAPARQPPTAAAVAASPCSTAKAFLAAALCPASHSCCCCLSACTCSKCYTCVSDQLLP